jgi:hypothetical protein
MYTSPHVKYPLFLSNIMKLEFSQQTFEKYLYIKFHENPFNGRTDGRKEVTKLIVVM